ncbi:alpha-galactosidase [Pedobacter cryoconitis]|uniref:Alpha-galactosidase n=1 Tax=Pedobacter cryoconitis TaxID=188932 RepID=A0A7W8ZQF5_9SPHI|nr:CBM35 domain-containing protein [Pedobacter cryoconitis]MBB5638090.1 alpha-galactosidase [Pedobacter cryoconitis]
MRSLLYAFIPCFLFLFFGMSAFSQQTIYEAETGTLSGGANIQSCNSCSGSKMVGNLGGTTNGSLLSSVNVSTAGTYNLTVYYATNDPRSIFLKVNNNAAIQLPCFSSGGWTTVATTTVVVNLNSGNNTIKMDNNSGWAPNVDKLEITAVNAAIKNMYFGVGNRIEYNLSTGKYNVYFNNTKTIIDAYASAKSNTTFTSTSYTTRTYATSAINDGFGAGTKHTISMSGNGLIPMQQVFYIYNSKEYFYTENILNGIGANSYYMSPLISGNSKLPFSGDLKALYVPFDNDTFIRYDAKSLSETVNTTSSEVSAIYDNNGRNGLVFGSIEHNDWKTGIKINGTGSNLTALEVFGGFVEEQTTRDKRGHGWVGVGTTTAKSPKMMIGYFSDWRDGMEEYGKSNRIAESRYIFSWTQPTPFGWNSWGAIQSNLSLTNAKGVVDFVNASLKGYRNGNTAYIDLDSYWDNLNDSQLKEFADYAKSKGLKPGIYWAPFVDWSKTNRIVEGSSTNYTEIWTKQNGAYHDLDGCRAIDPTHPATKQRIAYMIGRFKAAGFEMIKIDFIGHAAIEADSYYDSSVHTGMQAFRKGMEYLTDQLDGKMLVYAAISPNMATGRYAHTRRIACDAYSGIDETQYTLNSTNYGWWQTYVYNYIDGDHLVLKNETLGANKARVTSGVINGTLMMGDDFSSTGQWNGRAQTLFQNQDVLDIARNGVAFRPVEGNAGQGASEIFSRQIGGYYYIAVLNYGSNSKNYTVNLNRLGLNPDQNYSVKELYSGNILSVTGTLNTNLGAADAVIYRFNLGGSDQTSNLKDQKVFPVTSREFLPYPNPVKDWLKLNSEHVISSAKLTSLRTGQVLQIVTHVNSKNIELSMKDYQDPFYVLTVTNLDGSVQTYKIIKN